MDALAVRLGALRRGGERDMDAAISFFIRSFREGKLGRWTLDDVDGAEAALRTPTRFQQQLQSGPIDSELGMTGPVAKKLSTGRAKDISLGDRVSATVGSFVSQMANERVDTDAGRNMSANQQRKAELRAKAEYRLARTKAMGFDRKPSRPHRR